MRFLWLNNMQINLNVIKKYHIEELVLDIACIGKFDPTAKTHLLEAHSNNLGFISGVMDESF